MKYAIGILIALFVASCASAPKLTGHSRREPSQADTDNCLKDVRSDSDRQVEAAMRTEFNNGFFPNIKISGMKWACFYADAGLRVDEQTYSHSGKDILDEKFGVRYTPAVQGFIGSYPPREGRSADDTRNEIRLTKAGTLVIEYAQKKNKNPGCQDGDPSGADPENYTIQHMEICVPPSQLQKLLYPSK